MLNEQTLFMIFQFYIKKSHKDVMCRDIATGIIMDDDGRFGEK